MIPSKPTTTCSPKRTGIETCSWIRPGRSSRERSAAAPARSAGRSSGSGLGTGSSRARAGAGDALPLLGGVLGYRRGAEGGAPLPQSPRTPSPNIGKWGRRRAGRLGAGDPGHPAVAAPSPRGQGSGAVLARLGLSPRLSSCCSGSIFPSLPRPLAASPYGVRWQRASWAALGWVPGGGKLLRTLRLSAPARRLRGKRAPEGLEAASGSAWRWTCWSGVRAEKSQGYMRAP